MDRRACRQMDMHAKARMKMSRIVDMHVRERCLEEHPQHQYRHRQSN